MPQQSGLIGLSTMMLTWRQFTFLHRVRCWMSYRITSQIIGPGPAYSYSGPPFDKSPPQFHFRLAMKCTTSACWHRITDRQKTCRLLVLDMYLGCQTKSGLIEES